MGKWFFDQNAQCKIVANQDLSKNKKQEGYMAVKESKCLKTIYQ